MCACKPARADATFSFLAVKLAACRIAARGSLSFYASSTFRTCPSLWSYRAAERFSSKFPPSSMNFMESRPDVMMGKPVVEGTRITVECILERLAAGESVDQIASEHARLSREAVFAVVGFDGVRR